MSAPTAETTKLLTKQQKYPYRWDIVRIDEMYIDSRYQRDLKPITGEFDPRIVGMLTLSERPRQGKQYSVIDGQRRRDLIKREGIDIAPCVIFYDLSVEDEATLFSLFQRERKTITPYERYRADLVAGHPTVKAIDKILREEGFEMAPFETTPKSVRAVRAVETIYGEEPELLRKTLQLVARTWPEVPGSASEKMLKGLSIFVATTKDLDEEKFVRRLKGTLPSQIDRRATYLRDSRELTGTSPKFYAEVIEQMYRKGKG